MELKKYKLREIGKIVTGKTPSTNKKANYSDATIPFYTPEDVAKGFTMMNNNKRFISSIGFNEIKNNTLDGESVLVGCIGSDMGNVSYSNIKCATNQQINSITQFKKGIEPLYVYYLLSTKKEYLRQLAGSTTTPLLPKSVFENIEINIPNLEEQKRIGNLLSSIDQKIALNRKINDNLEAMAKQLYDYWFVQFDFPNEEGKPYKSSGGKMVWNEKLKREIPEGWEVDSLNKWLEIKSGFSFKSETYQKSGRYKIITIKNVQDGELITSGCEFVNEIPSCAKDYIALQIGDRLISLTGNCGRLAVVCEDNLLLNQRVGLLYCDKLYLEFLYNYLNSQQMKIIVDNLANGAAQANLSPVELCKTVCTIPQNNVLIEYNYKANAIRNAIIQNIQEIIALTKQRDELLPLLMNGQVSVN